MNTQTISLDVTKTPSAIPIVRIRRGDKNGITLKVALFDNGQALSLSSYTVKFFMRIPKHAGVYETSGTVSGNVATFTIDETYAAIATGVTCIAYCQIVKGDTFACSTGSVQVVVMESAEDE